MPRRVGVVSSAQTDWRDAWPGAQHIDLIAAAVHQALEGSGLRIEDVDFVIDSGSDVLDGRSISNCGFLGAMGAHHKEESRVEDDGLWAALYGVTKIASGAADVGPIIAYAKPSEADLQQFHATIAEPFCQRPVGLDEATAQGLIVQDCLRRSGLAEEAEVLLPVLNAICLAAGSARLFRSKCARAPLKPAALTALTPVEWNPTSPPDLRTRRRREAGSRAGCVAPGSSPAPPRRGARSGD